MTAREKLVELQLKADIEDEVSENTTQHREYIADLMIAHGVTVQEWIPVRDRLPDESGKYIVCCDDTGCPYGEGIWYQSGVVVIADVDVGVYGGMCWEWNENGVIYDLEGIVTHWMPLHLPQPPKGD